MPMGPIVVHAHYIPPGFLEAVGREPARYGVGLERASDGRMRFLFPGQDGTRPIPPGLLDLEQRVKALDAAGIRHLTPVESVREAGLGEANERAILDTNPARLFALSARQ